MFQHFFSTFSATPPNVQKLCQQLAATRSNFRNNKFRSNSRSSVGAYSEPVAQVCCVCILQSASAAKVAAARGGVSGVALGGTSDQYNSNAEVSRASSPRARGMFQGWRTHRSHRLATTTCLLSSPPCLLFPPASFRALQGCPGRSNSGTHDD